MDKYRNFVVIEELKTLLKQGKNEEALELADGMNPRRIKDNCDCMVLAEVYLNNGMLGRAKDCYSVVYDRKKSRRVAMELVNISIRLKKVDEAEKYFEEYKRMAPNDYFNYIFKYRIDRLKGRPLKEQAETLEQLKNAEFYDNWGYELAKIYHKMGETDKCVAVCDDIITWFGDGEWVDKAKAMIAYYSGEISLKELSSFGKADKDAVKDKSEEKTEVKNDERSESTADEKVEEKLNELPDEQLEEKVADVKEEALEEAEEIEVTTENTAEEAEEILTQTEEQTEAKEDVNAVYVDAAEEEAVIGMVAEKSGEEDYTEEEYTEEDLNFTEDDTIKVLAEDNRLISEIKTETREPDLSTDELARQIEEVLREENENRAAREQETDPQEMTREWRKEDMNKIATRPFVKPVEKKVEEKEDEQVEEPEEEDRSSPLIEAVGRELGFVGEEKEHSVQKKGWLSRLKEKHQEKERKRQEELDRTAEKEEEERLNREREEELARQRFIEKEKRKDRQRYLNNQMKMAQLASEKAKAINESERSDVLVTAKTEGNIYTPKKMKCIDVPVNSPVAEVLNRNGRTLEDYFGFFACQRDMAPQILKCLERLLDENEDYMNYCIIGDKGNGRKAIAHGFARFMSECGKIGNAQTVWTDAAKVNDIDLSAKTDKLAGRCLVISSAGSLKADSVDDVSKVIEKLNRKVMVVLTDYRHDMVELFRNREAFEELFRPRVSVPVFNQDDLFDYVDYKADKAGFVFETAAYDLMSKRIKGILRATEEGALARTEKYVVKTFDNAEQRNGEAYIRQTLEHEKHVRSNVIISEDLPISI